MSHCLICGCALGQGECVYNGLAGCYTWSDWKAAMELIKAYAKAQPDE